MVSSQSLQALAKANMVRVEVAVWKRGLTVDRFVEALTDGYPDPIGRVRLLEALCALPSVGPQKAKRVMRDVGVMATDKRLDDLTSRQRDHVALSVRRLVK